METNLDADMDMVMPLKLNIMPKRTSNQAEMSSAPEAQHSSSCDSTSPTKKVLGPTQAKKRLLAFAQQWTKTRENMENDKALEKQVNEHGTLKYTYVVEGDDGKKISFPAHLIKYTTTEPPLSYCPNPHYMSGVFQSRKEVLNRCGQDEKQIMYFIMNGSSPTCCDREFSGRYRKWYASRRAFVGKPGEEETPERYSPHWETDSDEEPERTGCTSWDYVEPTSNSRLLSNPIKIVSKVKINKVELPFFEDDDFLESLIACGKTEGKEESKKTAEAVQPTVTNAEDKDNRSDQHTPVNSTPSAAALDWSFDEEKGSRQEGKRRRSTPDWDEEWRSSSRYQDRRANRDFDEHRSKRSRRSSPRKDEGKRRSSSKHSPRDRDEADVSLASEEWAADFVKEWSVPPEEDPDEVVDDVSESKRLSLDQRLELELGIKIESESYQALTTSPLPVDQSSQDDSPVKRRSAFGPVAAPIDAIIFQCPKALPAQPYIPPHLQSRLVRPLNRALPPSTKDSNKPEDGEESKQDCDSEQPTDEEQRKKNWDKELKHLEALAINLETADDSVWQELEEKLLLFEAANILPSSSESPLPTEQETDESGQKNTVIELKEAGKGILVMPRISLMLDGTAASQKKAVMFADSIRPGYGSSSEEDDLPPARSPSPPPIVQPPAEPKKSQKKTKKQKKTKFLGPDYDPMYDLMPPPPPPPGSPPPHLPQGRSLDSPPPLIESAIPLLGNSPCAVDPGPC